MVSILKAIISHEKYEDNLLKNYKLSSKLYKSTNTNNSDIHKLDIAKYETNLNLQNQKFVQLINESIEKHDEGIKLDQIK